MQPSTELMDAELMRRMIGGSEDAFAMIYQRCGGPVYRFALHMTGDAHTSEEITQETFLKLISNPLDYKASRGPLIAWLLGIARNLVRQTAAPARETESLEESSASEIASICDPFADLTRRETIAAVRQAILSLPANYREAVVLCELQELDYRDAALVLNCPVGTIRSRLHRARTMLISKLQARCFA